MNHKTFTEPTQIELEKLKTKFDKLTYEQKLIFWADHKFNWKFSELPIISKGRESEKSEPIISIVPKDDAQRLLCNRWRLKCFLENNPDCSIEKVAEKHTRAITNNPQSIRNTIEQIKEISDEIKSCKWTDRSLETAYYCWGFQSVVRADNEGLEMGSDEFNHFLPHYARGILHAYYQPFLKQELLRLKQEEKSKTLTPSTNRHTPPKETEPLNSFDFIDGKNSHNQLDCLRNILEKLKQNKYKIEYVSNDVKQTDFKRIFTNVPLSKISPIVWKKSIASLRYFIKQFQFPFKISNKSRFEIASRCFSIKDINLDYEKIDRAKDLSNKDKMAIDLILK